MAPNRPRNPIRLSLKVPVFSPPKGASLSIGRPVCGDKALYVSVLYGCRQLARLDRENLSPQWVVSTPGSYLLFGERRGVVLASNEGAEPAGFDGETGTLLWTREGGWPEGLWRDPASSSSLSIVTGSHLELIEAATGKTVERVPLPAEGRPSIHGDHVVVTNRDHPWACMDRVTRRVLWRRDLMQEMDAYADALPRSDLYFIRPSSLPDRFLVTRNGATFAFSLDGGRLLWHAPVRAEHTVTVAGGSAWVLLSARLVGMDEASGQVLIDRQQEEFRMMGPYGAATGAGWGDFVVFAMQSGHVAAFERATGDLVFVRRFRTSLWDPIVVDGRVIVPTSDGQLLVFAESSR